MVPLSENVIAAHGPGLSIFGEHRRSDLGDFLKRVDKAIAQGLPARAEKNSASYLGRYFPLLDPDI